MTKLTLNKSFNSKVERSPRVIKVAEAFGLGMEDHEFVVLDEVELEINDGDIVYVEGQSGSGKSVLLREAVAGLEAAGKSVMNIDDIEFEDKPLIDQIGDSLADAMRLLSFAGLNDAYLYIRSPKQLSDGQKYRFRLAKLVEANADVWVADEFGAVLDRVTAKLVAFNLAKTARRNGKTLMVATTHKDLVGELAPNIQVTKRYNDRIEIKNG